MDRQEVVSSVIEAIGHARVLEIEFENGRIYQYYNVPEDIYEEMLGSESKGKYFNANVRGKYPYREVEFKEHG